MSTNTYDVAIIGAGPNGLTAAAYLAKAGASVVVLEHRFERGGTFASDDYSTPFTYNLAQFSVPLGKELPPYQDLELDKHSVGFVEPAVAFSVRTGDGQTTSIGRGGVGLGHRAEALFAAADVAIRPLLYSAPSSYDKALTQLRELNSEAAELAELTPDGLVDLVDGAAAAIAVRYAAGLAGFTAGDQKFGIIGAFVLARQFSPTLVRGGTKSLANGIYRVAANAGARCYVSATVRAVTRESDGYILKLADGRTFSTKAVISTADVRTNVELLSPDLVTDELRATAQGWEYDVTGPFIAHYGIKGEPHTDLDPSTNAAMHIIGFDDVGDVAEHFAAAERGELPKRHAGHVSLTSVHDPLQASPGPYGPLHTLRFESYAPLQHPEGAWTRKRVDLRKEIWSVLEDALPTLSEATLLFQFADSPGDLAKRFPTARNGSVRQGALIAEQTLDQRPDQSTSSTRTPIDGFYVAGGGVHPGVPGSLGGGYLVADAVVEDLGLTKWWGEPSFSSDVAGK
ncbi:FAD-dependent oxidoreductase [Rhodococcus sp. A14]|uniref:FAD-dependent oxidoreductase n=1 Tax=Rhodococcus sp. A14 TaxID=1194106 RepID=UPI0014243592|nr:NAD(P)-binding protein [Rhodococcus sp. A14]